MFGIVLVFGALIGALGGFLAARADATPGPQPPDAKTHQPAQREAEHDRDRAAGAAVAAPSAVWPDWTVAASFAVAVGVAWGSPHRSSGGRAACRLVGLEVAPEVVGRHQDVVGARLREDGVRAAAALRSPTRWPSTRSDTLLSAAPKPSVCEPLKASFWRSG